MEEEEDLFSYLDIKEDVEDSSKQSYLDNEFQVIDPQSLVQQEEQKEEEMYLANNPFY